MHDPQYPEPRSSTHSGLSFRLFGLPVTVQPWFFLTAYIVGRQSIDIVTESVWIVVVFLGVLVHELGHAVAARSAGLSPSITLHGFGGTTSWAPVRPIGPWAQIGITAAGPVLGIATGGLAWALLEWGVLGWASFVLRDMMWVNLGWGVLNLLPVLPLDGGQIAGTLAGLVAGRRGRVAMRVLSLVLLAGIAGWGLLGGRLWTLFLAIILGYVNVDALRREVASGG
jgi:membrane-associated protease RseP (regulator of RpoE activity)